MLDWLRGTKKKKKTTEDRLAAWRQAWAAVVEGANGPTVEELRRRLEATDVAGSDVELEVEMLDALEELGKLQRQLAAGSLPVVETHHRVVGQDACHFTAPASLPDGQASGRVLMTAVRSIFVGGGRTVMLPWHAVREVIRLERDVVLTRSEASPGAHYRFNNYTDAVTAAFLARHLRGKPQGHL